MKQFTLWDHQKEAYSRAMPLSGFGFFFEMGTGKTLATITVLRGKYNAHGKLLRTLIFGPPIVVQNWVSEFKAFSNIPRKDVVALQGPGKKRVKKFESKAFDNLGRPLDGIFITNYEALYMKELYALFTRWGADIIVWDESHKLKDMKSKRTKLAVKLSTPAKYRYLLTGTPILNTPMDLFSQFLILDGGETFGRDFYHFRNRYFYDKNAGMPANVHFPNWVARDSLMEDLSQRIGQVSMSIKKSECLSLPPLVRHVVKIQLGEEQRRVYNSMEKAYIAEVDGGVCSATLALTKGLRLQQIASGFLPVEVVDKNGKSSFKMARVVNNPRSKALKDLIETITPHAKVIVWAVFKDNYEAITKVCDELGVKYAAITGEQSQKQKDEAIRAFDKDEKCRVIYGHPGAGGIGVNLVAASYAITYSRGFSLEHDLQSKARNYRGGSEIHEKITHIEIMADSTIDEKIAEALHAKEKISEKIIINAVKELKNERRNRVNSAR